MRALVLALALCGCGAIGDPGGGSSHLPVGGGGPFMPLAPDPDIPINAPFVLLDNLADFDEPSVLADGERLALWVTAKRREVTRIEHADAPRLTDGFGEPQPSLEADQPWEAGAVSGPSVLRGRPWIMFYTAGGAIGWATADDDEGHVWTKAPGPALRANAAEEGNVLGAPGVARVGDRVRVYYAAGGQIWAAEAPYEDVAARRETTWTRLDGDPSTPARDPMVAPPPYAVRLDRPWARSENTPGGRVRHDLFFTAVRPEGERTTCGFAASYDARRFERLAQPILPETLIARACTGTRYLAGAAVLYVQRLGSRESIAAGLSGDP